MRGYFGRGHLAYIVVSIILLGVATYLVTRNQDDDLTASLLVSLLAIILRAGEWIWLHDRVKIIVADKKEAPHDRAA